ENVIMNSYMDFRFALKDAEGLALQVLQTQKGNLDQAQQELTRTAEVVKTYAGTDQAEKSLLELERDKSQRTFDQEDNRYQLILDVANNLKEGYNVGEVLVMKLKQTHDVKNQVHRKIITFFTTNEHVFTTMDAVYTSQFGLHELTRTSEAMTEGVNKGLEDIAAMGRELEKAGLQAGYGPSLNTASVQMLVDAVVSFQTETRQIITALREMSTQNAQEIERIVEEGKQKCVAAIGKYEAKAA
ncbi:MAG: cell surface protein, partial [Nanoarchaeota archaeon]